MRLQQIIFLLLIGISIKATAQNKPCNLQDGQLHSVYVFSKNTSHTIIDLFGERVNPATISLIYIKTPESKAETDSLCLAGKLDGTFIFPDKDASKTIRLCNANEYVAALKNKIELNIEEE